MSTIRAQIIFCLLALSTVIQLALGNELLLYVRFEEELQPLEIEMDANVGQLKDAIAKQLHIARDGMILHFQGTEYAGDDHTDSANAIPMADIGLSMEAVIDVSRNAKQMAKDFLRMKFEIIYDADAFINDGNGIVRFLNKCIERSVWLLSDSDSNVSNALLLRVRVPNSNHANANHANVPNCRSNNPNVPNANANHANIYGRNEERHLDWQTIRQIFDSFRVLDWFRTDFCIDDIYRMIYCTDDTHRSSPLMTAIRTQNKAVIRMVMGAGAFLFHWTVAGERMPIMVAISEAAERGAVSFEADELEREFEFIQFLLREGERVAERRRNEIQSDRTIRSYYGPQLKASTVNGVWWCDGCDAEDVVTPMTLLDFVMRNGANSSGTTIYGKVAKHLREHYSAMTFAEISNAKLQWDEHFLQQIRDNGNAAEQRRMANAYLDGMSFVDALGDSRDAVLSTVTVNDDRNDIRAFIASAVVDLSQTDEPLFVRSLNVSIEMLAFGGYSDLLTPLLGGAVDAMEVSVLRTVIAFGDRGIVNAKLGIQSDLDLNIHWKRYFDSRPNINRAASAIMRALQFGVANADMCPPQKLRGIIELLIDSGASVYGGGENDIGFGLGSHLGCEFYVKPTPLILSVKICDMQIVELIVRQQSELGKVEVISVHWATQMVEVAESKGKNEVAEYLRSHACESANDTTSIGSDCAQSDPTII